MKAVLFDLYGTLLRVERPRFHKEVPRRLGVGGREWVAFVRRELLRRPFSSSRQLVDRICAVLAPSADAAVREQCAIAIDDEVASVRPAAGAVPFLWFLKRRGYKLGLLSNLASTHRSPLFSSGLGDLFDAVELSCDTGRTKPEVESYLHLCRRLEVEPEDALFIGDSRRNDVEAPARLGMRSICADEQAVGALGFRDLAAGDARPYFAAGDVLDFGGRRYRVQSLTPVTEEEQGRYNLVARLVVAGENGEESVLFCKRYASPTAAFAEVFAHELAHRLGLPACRAQVLERSEPLLLTTEARGAKFGGLVDVAVTREIARHLVFAYVFSNADMRPRNAFLWRRAADPGKESGAEMTMIDLEHCFFNLAIDVGDVDRNLEPQGLDALGNDGLAARLRRQVLSPAAMRRARRSFFRGEHEQLPLVRHLKEGFAAAYDHVQGQSSMILELLRERIYREPYLIIGTHGYRRAMTRIDVDDVERRLSESKETLGERLY
jgi:FMN phosphatase YigB (HAD superfamily)